MNRRERFERDLRTMLREEGVDPMPPDSEIAEVVEFFERHGSRALPMLRRTAREMIRAHHEAEGKGHGENRSRPHTDKR